MGKSAITLALVAATLAPAQAPAAASRGQERLENFDSRRGEAVEVPVASRRARRSLDSRLGAEGFVESDPLTGGVIRAGRADGFLTGPSGSRPVDVALGYVRSHPDVFGLDAGDVRGLSLDRRYRSWDGVTHLYFVQRSRGLSSLDTGVDVHVDARGRIAAISARAVPDFEAPPVVPRLSRRQALFVAKLSIRAPRRASAGDSAGLVVFADPQGERLAWKVTAEDEEGSLYEVIVDAGRGSVLARRSLTEFVAAATVYENHPGASEGGTPTAVDLQAPEGGAWINLAGAGRTKLDGNNAHAYADVNANDAADAVEEVPAADGTNWIYPRTPFARPGCPVAGCAWDPADSSSKATNENQVTTQVFYLVNRFHDWLLAAPIGFDEASGNFEHVNSSGQGIGHDRVLAEANDGSALNNASFTTSPDGTPPRMQMYFTSAGGQSQNTGEDASVVLHEYTHGLTNRLVGNVSGLTELQSRSMGEGWSDWYALDYLVANGFEVDSDAQAELKLGQHSFPPDGVRTEGTDCRVGASSAGCPGTGAAGSGGYTYGDLGKVGGAGSVHGNGEIWAQTLWDLRDAVGPTVARGLITGGLRLSPNAPSFLSMRDSILQADVTTYSGSHRDAIWRVFAARGMGVGASTAGPGSESVTEDFSAPPTAVTGAASAVAATGATLNGVVDPNGAATSYAFQYGTSTAYGQQSATVPAGAGTDPVAAAATIGGLQPGVQYHFRLLAIRNGVIAHTGADSTFTTSAAPPPATQPTPAIPGGATPSGDRRASSLVVFPRANTITVASAGAFRFRFLGRPPGARGVATFTGFAPAVKTLRLGRKGFTVPARGRVSLTPRLSRSNRMVLRWLGRVRMSVNIRLSGRSFRKAFTLRAPRRPRR